MAEWLTLDAVIHAEAGCQKFRGFGFAAQDSLVLVPAAEIIHLLPWYVVVFVCSEQHDRYHLAALLSLQPRANVFVANDGKWQASYVPSQYRGYPFGLTSRDELCIDVESGLFSNPAGLDHQALFDHGDFTDIARKVRDFHLERRKALQVTQGLVDQLQSADLIRPWPIRWQPKSKPQTVKGYCGIDEDRLRSLPADTYAELAHSGALGLAYAQLFSRPRVADLQVRHSRHPPPGGKAPAPKRHLHAVDNVEDLGSFFGENDDELRF